jgi:RNA polymerase sigma factor (sigma-70 family)
MGQGQVGPALCDPAEEPAAEKLTDRQLLERFAHRRDEDAFATLVERHRALVLGVGRRVLRQSEDAEDVFQATFLVLARRAASIRWHESVGNWLYGVAHRLACKMRTAGTRRQTREREASDLAAAGSMPKEAWEQLCQLLDEELNRLPQKVRAPVLLCYLEGQPREEAARQLGWSRRTLQRRLEEGLEILRERLSRRGIALSLALLALGLTGSNATPASAALAAATVRAAGVFAAGMTGSISPPVAALAAQVLRSMALAKLKWSAVSLAAAGLALGGAIGIYQMATRPLAQVETGQQAATDARPLAGPARQETGATAVKPAVLSQAALPPPTAHTQEQPRHTGEPVAVTVLPTEKTAEPNRQQDTASKTGKARPVRERFRKVPPFAEPVETKNPASGVDKMKLDGPTTKNPKTETPPALRPGTAAGADRPPSR